MSAMERYTRFYFINRFLDDIYSFYRTGLFDKPRRRAMSSSGRGYIKRNKEKKATKKREQQRNVYQHKNVYK